MFIILDIYRKREERGGEEAKEGRELGILGYKPMAAKNGALNPYQFKLRLFLRIGKALPYSWKLAPVCRA